MTNKVAPSKPFPLKTKWPDVRGPFVLTIEWDFFDGRLAPSGIILRLRDPDPAAERMVTRGTTERWLRPRRPLETSDLRGIPLRKEAERLRAAELSFADVAASMAPLQAEEIAAAAAAWRASAGQPRGPRPDMDHYREVARVYRLAEAEGRSATEAVAEQVYGGKRTVPDQPTSNERYGAAGRAIHRARKLGLLDPARKEGSK